ncbi:MAG: ATP-binding protein [Gammaproteobacteria bacterium]|nr:ATP-binding protein [Gammaproteobacteria bacterium]
MSESERERQRSVLRERAAEVLQLHPQETPTIATADVQELLHELHVHEVELGLQNEFLREAQMDLAHAHDRYADLYDFAPVGYLTLEEDGAIAEANLTMAMMLHVDRKTLRTSRLSHFLTQDSQDTFYRHCQAVFGGDNREVCEVGLVCGDGQRITVQMESLPFAPGRGRRCRSALMDVTARKQAETALQRLAGTLEDKVAARTAQLERERAFSDSILENQPAPVLVLDDTGAVLRYNRACAAAAGNDFSAYQGTRGWLGLVPAEERPAVERMLARLEGGEAPLSQESRWSHADGTRRLFSWNYDVVSDPDDGSRYIIATGVDITALRAAEQDASRRLAEAARMQRLYTAAELGSALAHELKQPLGAIALFAAAARKQLEEEPLSRDRLIRNLEQIAESAHFGDEVVRRMRDFLRVGCDLEPAPFDLSATVERAAGLLAMRMEAAGFQLRVEPAEGIPPVHGAAVHVEQVLLNLLGNAIEAMDGGGGEIAVAVRRDGEMVRVSVRDGGPGVEAEVAEHLFEALYSTKDQGLGVGLGISRDLVRAYGGQLWVEPRSPGGVFHFTLPVAAGEAPP